MPAAASVVTRGHCIRLAGERSDDASSWRCVALRVSCGCRVNSERAISATTQHVCDCEAAACHGRRDQCMVADPAAEDHAAGGATDE